jgi:hypothetical protein
MPTVTTGLDGVKQLIQIVLKIGVNNFFKKL